MAGGRRIFTEDGMSVCFIEPYTTQLLADGIFDASDRPLNRDSVLEVYACLRDECEKAGVKLHTSDFVPADERGDAVFHVSSINSYSMLHREMSGRRDVFLGSYYLHEPPVDVRSNPRSTYRRLDELSARYRRVYVGCAEEAIRELNGVPAQFHTKHFFYPQSPDGVFEGLWARRERKPLVMINSANYSPMRGLELYSERIRAISYFGSRSLIDLYGHRWREFPARLAVQSAIRLASRPSARHASSLRCALWMLANLRPVLRSYRGTCASKYQTLAGYDFAVCYENFRIRGFITEKLLDCLFAGTIPIYWGAPDVEDWIPRDCFIDRGEFRSHADLHAFLQSLGEDDKRRYREAGRDFVASDRFRPFSRDFFAERFVRDIEEDLKLIEFGAELDERTKEVRA